MLCAICKMEAEENCGSLEVRVCQFCAETREGAAVLASLNPSPTPSIAPHVPPKKASTPNEGGIGRMILGGLMGIVLTVLVVLVYSMYGDAGKEAIVKEVLAGRGIHVDSVEILQYSTYPTNQGQELQNFIAQGSYEGYLYRAKVQYMKGRDPGQNGMEFQQGSSTQSAGNFYNF
jgi:hypothetical protein